MEKHTQIGSGSKEPYVLISLIHVQYNMLEQYCNKSNNSNFDKPTPNPVSIPLNYIQPGFVKPQPEIHRKSIDKKVREKKSSTSKDTSSSSDKATTVTKSVKEDREEEQKEEKQEEKTKTVAAKKYEQTQIAVSKQSTIVDGDLYANKRNANKENYSGPFISDPGGATLDSGGNIVGRNHHPGFVVYQNPDTRDTDKMTNTATLTRLFPTLVSTFKSSGYDLCQPVCCTSTVVTNEVPKIYVSDLKTLNVSETTCLMPPNISCDMRDQIHSILREGLNPSQITLVRAASVNFVSNQCAPVVTTSAVTTQSAVALCPWDFCVNFYC